MIVINGAKYAIRQEVSIVRTDLHGTVLAVEWRDANTPNYEVSYWVNGDEKRGYFSEWRLNDHP